ncbi:MAG TPA: tyrosinase family protein [Solirubrobacterales bacterium]|nr:tyrosinase family protein [Solirubrobacterales bacterium]
MATGAPSVQRQAVPVRHRPSIAEMTAPQLQELREALAKFLRIKDDRGYQHWAGIHGLPLPMYCSQAHGKPAFLPWHRAYLYRFEQALRDTGHDVMLPWWDWTRIRRVPKAYAEPKRPDGTDNPMYSVRINDEALRQGREGRGDRGSIRLAGHPDTFRQPGREENENHEKFALPTGTEIARLLRYSDFARFTEYLDNYHGEVHMWVGGHMTDIPFAAYDPLFWAHHCMIDRIWRKWQLQHTQSSFPSNVLHQVMEPFHLTAQQVLDPTALGYDYSLSITQVGS